MSYTVWTNHVFRPEARAIFEEGIRAGGHRLIVSPTASPSVLAAGTEDETLAQADVAFGQPDAGQILHCRRLKYVALSTAGYTRYDDPRFRNAMRDRALPFTNASRVFADPCAQHVLAQMLAFERSLPSQLRNQDGPREWRYLEDRFASGVLTGKRVLILGFGAIARRLVELLRPFDCTILAYRRAARGDEGVPVIIDEDINRELNQADHVVNILPDNEETRAWFNAGCFLQMKRTARFYNIGRGTTIDQTAMMAALNTQYIAGAYLDVMDPEPLPPDHPLWKTKNCFLTCHIGGGTRHQDEDLARHFLANLTAFERGERLTDRII